MLVFEWLIDLLAGRGGETRSRGRDEISLEYSGTWYIFIEVHAVVMYCLDHVILFYREKNQVHQSIQKRRVRKVVFVLPLPALYLPSRSSSPWHSLSYCIMLLSILGIIVRTIILIRVTV